MIEIAPKVRTGPSCNRACVYFPKNQPPAFINICKFLYLYMLQKIKQIFSFYHTGFREMDRWGRQVWLIILVKLFIMFVILKLFFFPDLLKRNFETDEQRSEYVLEQLTK